VSLFHVGATTTAERGLSVLGGGGLSKSVALTWNEWTTGWRREKVAWRNRNLRLTKKSPAPVLHAPEGRPGNVHIAIPTPTGSLDEATTFRPPQCVGQKLAGSGTGVVPSESEAKVVEMGETAIPDGGGHVACAPHGKVRFCRSSKRGQVLAL
jgi:hypothetical protein